MRIQFNKPKQVDLSSLKLDKSPEEIEEEEYDAFLTKPLKPENLIITEVLKETDTDFLDLWGMKMAELRELYKSKWGTGRMVGISKIDLITKIMDLNDKE